DTASENVPLDLGKPEFDLIQPRGIRGREMEMYARMCGEKRADLLRLVRGEIVENDVNLASTGLRIHDVGEEGQEVLARVPRRGLADDFAGPCVERCIERQRAVAVVLESVSFGATWRKREHGI